MNSIPDAELFFDWLPPSFTKGTRAITTSRTITENESRRTHVGVVELAIVIAASTAARTPSMRLIQRVA